MKKYEAGLRISRPAITPASAKACVANNEEGSKPFQMIAASKSSAATAELAVADQRRGRSNSSSTSGLRICRIAKAPAVVTAAKSRTADSHGKRAENSERQAWAEARNRSTEPAQARPTSFSLQANQKAPKA